MLKISKAVIIGFLIFTQLPLWARNSTNLPYTRSGYGELADRSFGAGRTMGGASCRLRSSKQINPLNPASYSYMDSLTFFFDFGASGQVSWFYDGTSKQRQMNGNVEYVAIQLPITRRLAMSIGLLPYSYMGYDSGESRTEGGLSWGEGFSGRGDLSDACLGLSYGIWKGRLSIDVNAEFLFGNITRSRSLTSPSSTGADDMYGDQRYEIHDLELDSGIQYTHPLSKTEHVTVGFVYSPGKKLNTAVYDTQLVGSSATSEYTRSDIIKNYRFGMPDSYGTDVSYVKEDWLTLAADFLYEDWANAYFDSEKGQFKNRTRVAAGAEFIPRYGSRSYLECIRYRAGFHYSDSCLRASRSGKNDYREHGYNEYGASVGFGLPLIDSRSLVSLSFECVKIHLELRTMIDEQYFRFTVSYTFDELWFFKREVS